MTGEWILRTIFYPIDKIVYKFIPVVYDFITELAQQDIFKNNDAIDQIAGRIYAILGIYVLFRLAFILLSAVVDPNRLMEKEKGFGKIMTRFIIGLFMIAAIPWVFDYAYKVQSVILKNGIITNIVFGDSAENATAGNTLSKATLSAFLTCKESDTTNCEADGEMTEAFTSAYDNGDWSLLDDALSEKEGSGYKYEYRGIISTVAGIAILLLLITFSFDVAVRTVKLGFLEMVFPLAIVGYIEPGGKGFASWQKTCVSTYINLFTRLLAISFTGYIISLLDPFNSTKVTIEAGNSATELLLRVFIIIGTLIFAKEAPKIIADMFGVKDAGLGGFNPFKKINGMVGAGIIGGAVGVGAKVLGAGAGGIAGAAYAKSKGGSLLAGAGQGIKTGFGNVKMKDAAKGNITGIGKTLKAGTFGAFNKGGSYAAGKVTGKEEKIGLMNTVKTNMAKGANAMHQGALSASEASRWDDLKSKIASGNSLYSTEYQKAMDNVKRAKQENIDRETARNKWRVLYENDPNGEYQGKDGNMHAYKEAYELSNKNSIQAQKNLDFIKGELDKMGKIDLYKKDAETREFVERMESTDKNVQLNSEFNHTYSGPSPILKNVPDENPRGPGGPTA